MDNNTQHPTEPILEAILQNQDENAKSQEKVLEAILQTIDSTDPEPLLGAQLVQSKKNADNIVNAVKEAKVTITIDGADTATYQGGKGDKGEKGDKGDKGDRGDKGEVGEKGLDGKDGFDGLRGTDGLDGKDGVDGKDGIDGKDGKNGAKGDKGDKGEPGKDGKSISQDIVKQFEKKIKDTESNLLWVNNGAVKSIVAGTNVTVTGDPLNPIISSTGGGTVGPGTANEIAYFDTTTTVNSLTTATYPSITELSYVKGVTSAIQTQLNAKQTTLVSATNIKTVNGSSLLGSGDLVVSGAGDMILASAQTNTGAKTFNSNTLWDKGNMVFNVKAYGAVGDDSTNDTAAIQAAVDAAGAVGGVVWFPAGIYRMSTTALLLYTGSTPYSSITLAGAGAGKAIIKQMTTGVDVIKGLNNTTGSVQLLNVTIRDLTLSFGGTTTNSGNGIYLAQVAADGPSFQQMNFKNLILDNFGATGKYGFNAESLIVSSLENVMARSCANGFYLNGGAFGNYDSINTSVTFNNCYANGTNTVLGFNIYRSQYISFNACAADGNTTAAYNINDCSGISFNGCGVEWATGASASAYKFTAAVQCTINGGYIYQGTGTTTNAVYLTSTSTGITATGLAYYQDGGTLTNGFLVDAGSSVTNINCSFSGGTVTNQTNINATGVYKTPGTPRRIAVSNSTTPAINIGACDVYEDTGLTGAVTTVTITGTPEPGQKLITSFTGTASRAITFSGTYFEASGAVAIPTTTSSTTRLDIGWIYNSATSKFRCVASA
jgi:hypothetical protein